MMEKHWTKCKVEPNQIAVQAGCGSILESLFYMLANEGDSIILPGPIYPNFMVDAFLRARVSIEVAPCSWENDFEITEDILESAYQNALKNGATPKIMLLCQPCNPNGKIYSRS